MGVLEVKGDGRAGSLFSRSSMKPPRLRRIKPTTPVVDNEDQLPSMKPPRLRRIKPGAGRVVLDVWRPFNEAASVEADKTPRNYPTDLKFFSAGLARTFRYSKTNPTKNRIDAH